MIKLTPAYAAQMNAGRYIKKRKRPTLKGESLIMLVATSIICIYLLNTYILFVQTYKLYGNVLTTYKKYGII